MLNRRDFIKISALLAAGAVLPLYLVDQVSAIETDRPMPTGARPHLCHRGHLRSGCAFRPELTDMWAGGGADLPDPNRW